MLTPARIFAALGVACTGTLTIYGPILPRWALISIGVVNLFSGAIVAMSGPVQASKDKSP